MLMQLPSIVVVVIYLLAALLPALFLMRYIYRKDTIEKEPKGMLVVITSYSIHYTKLYDELHRIVAGLCRLDGTLARKTFFEDERERV